ncbi:hypothetical protein DV515_00009271 [Chloebia gouldiae]|uniref:Uncharacterized protein n=1 Tax=Chloebia gouldiae TaxID=44316 RepID=A0A3L8SCK8_CHLGU|nr:hypothetical protein DV515_00009271 [Chloebia gouldiae]
MTATYQHIPKVLKVLCKSNFLLEFMLGGGGVGAGWGGGESGGVENDNNKKSAVCQQPQPGERRQLMQPRSWDAPGMVACSSWATSQCHLLAPVRRAWKFPRRCLLQGRSRVLMALLPRLRSSRPRRCGEGWQCAHRPGHRQPILTPTLIGSCYRDRSISPRHNLTELQVEKEEIGLVVGRLREPYSQLRLGAGRTVSRSDLQRRGASLDLPPFAPMAYRPTFKVSGIYFGNTSQRFIFQRRVYCISKCFLRIKSFTSLAKDKGSASQTKRHLLYFWIPRSSKRQAALKSPEQLQAEKETPVPHCATKAAGREMEIVCLVMDIYHLNSTITSSYCTTFPPDIAWMIFSCKNSSYPIKGENESTWTSQLGGRYRARRGWLSSGKFDCCEEHIHEIHHSKNDYFLVICRFIELNVKETDNHGNNTQNKNSPIEIKFILMSAEAKSYLLKASLQGRKQKANSLVVPAPISSATQPLSRLVLRSHAPVQQLWMY